jgi:hypothetical protein
MADIFFSLDEKHQQIFKQKGEEATSKILTLISSTKATLNAVFSIIKSWLVSIPNINKYFIEKESRIKADKILEINK